VSARGPGGEAVAEADAGARPGEEPPLRAVLPDLVEPGRSLGPAWPGGAAERITVVAAAMAKAPAQRLMAFPFLSGPCVRQLNAVHASDEVNRRSGGMGRRSTPTCPMRWWPRSSPWNGVPGPLGSLMLPPVTSSAPTPGEDLSDAPKVVDTHWLAQDAERLLGVPESIASACLETELRFLQMRGLAKLDDDTGSLQ
jgi:hypothetical protein